jgi:DNA methylase
VALALTDQQGWILRNSIVWNKVKGGPDNATDKLRNVHEMLFHFVKSPKGYLYDVDAARKPPGSAKVLNGAVVSATGVSGVRYRRQANPMGHRT